MGTLAGVLIGLVLAGALFLVLLKNGHLKDLLTPNGFEKTIITEKVVYVNKNKELEEYEEFQTLLAGLELSKDYDLDKKTIKDAYDIKLAELQNIRDAGKKEADKIKTSSIGEIEKAYDTSQKVRAKTKSDADNEWSKNGTARDTDKNKARNEFNKRVEEIERLFEKQRVEYYNKKQGADTVYSKEQDVYYANKSKAQTLFNNTKGVIDTKYYADQKIFEKEYLKESKKVSDEKRKDLLTKLTEEQKEKYKKFL